MTHSYSSYLFEILLNKQDSLVGSIASLYRALSYIIFGARPAIKKINVLKSKSKIFHVRKINSIIVQQNEETDVECRLQASRQENKKKKAGHKEAKSRGKIKRGKNDDITKA